MNQLHIFKETTASSGMASPNVSITTLIFFVVAMFLFLYWLFEKISQINWKVYWCWQGSDYNQDTIEEKAGRLVTLAISSLLKLVFFVFCLYLTYQKVSIDWINREVFLNNASLISVWESTRAVIILYEIRGALLFFFSIYCIKYAYTFLRCVLFPLFIGAKYKVNEAKGIISDAFKDIGAAAKEKRALKKFYEPGESDEEK